MRVLSIARLLPLVATLAAGACSSSGGQPTSDGGGGTFLVSASGDGHETITPSATQSADSGGTVAFTVTANDGYTRSNTVGGSCSAGSWSGDTYTTGAITAACTVTFSATIESFTVTASGDGNETITPATAQTVADGSTQSFTVTAADGYTRSSTVGGTCAAGTWSGDSYTTGAITADCTVSFSATLESFTVTASGDGHETIAPNTPQTVADGSTQAFTVTGNGSYVVSTTVGGDCPAGSWSGSVYTTGAITADCSVSFTAALPTFTVSSFGDGNEVISPDSAQTVSQGGTQSFTVTANAGYTVSLSVGGSCPTGSWSAGVYTTGAVTADCTVGFSASVPPPPTFTVSPPVLILATAGAARHVTITNSGGSTAVNVAIISGALPSGTVTSSDCGYSLAASQSCTFTVVPGMTASAAPPAAAGYGDFAASADNSSNSPTFLVTVVDYGNIIQGGYLFDIDDTTAADGSIAGKVVAQSDQSSDAQWSADNSTILGIDDTSTASAPSPSGPAYPTGTPTPANCAGALDGACDSGNIVGYETSMSNALGSFAAGACRATIATYDDWYLPSICELTSAAGSFCNGLQNIETSLVANGIGQMSGNYYWASTEASDQPSVGAWLAGVDSDVSMVAAGEDSKGDRANVRCVRALTDD